MLLERRRLVQAGGLRAKDKGMNKAEASLALFSPPPFALPPSSARSHFFPAYSSFSFQSVIPVMTMPAPRFCRPSTGRPASQNRLNLPRCRLVRPGGAIAVEIMGAAVMIAGGTAGRCLLLLVLLCNTRLRVLAVAVPRRRRIKSSRFCLYALDRPSRGWRT